MPRCSKYVGLRLNVGEVLLEMDQLTFETAEEIFGHGVVVGIAPAGHALADTAGLRTVNLEAALNLVWCDGVAVVGISGPLIGPPPHGGDSGHLHLPVYALAGAAKLRLLR